MCLAWPGVGRHPLGAVVSNTNLGYLVLDQRKLSHRGIPIAGPQGGSVKLSRTSGIG